MTSRMATLANSESTFYYVTEETTAATKWRHRGPLSDPENKSPGVTEPFWPLLLPHYQQSVAQLLDVYELRTLTGIYCISKYAYKYHWRWMNTALSTLCHMSNSSKILT